MDNMKIYNAVRSVPPEAKKPIQAGRLKGMTDINPMWRIKKLTEIFGPCGTGWKYRIDKREFVPGAEGQVAVFVDVQLFYWESDSWSEGIPGTGGAMYVSKEKNGLYTDDEAPKKALTDALSVAAKALGIGADVYFERDTSKYSAPPSGIPASKPAANPKPADWSKPVGPVCHECGREIKGISVDSKPVHTGKEVAEITRKEYNVTLCAKCAQSRGYVWQ